ncbi:MAG: hypothetical protein Q7K42_05315 [Candidatus Diapherotrites archaeon]|nr:hypothetical protein [Candidatus Diapherotrites archaeon]
MGIVDQRLTKAILALFAKHGYLEKDVNRGNAYTLTKKSIDLGVREAKDLFNLAKEDKIKDPAIHEFFKNNGLIDTLLLVTRKQEEKKRKRPKIISLEKLRRRQKPR